MKFDRWILWLLLPAGLVMTVFMLGLLQIGWLSLHDEGQLGLRQYIDFFARADYRQTVLHTIVMACKTTIICLAVSYPIAFAITRATRFRALLLTLVIMPWLVSIVVRTYGWIVLLGNRGAINALITGAGLTEGPVRLLFNDTGVLIGLVHVFCPFMVISILNVLANVDRSFENASMSLGAGPIETFLRVTLPLTSPGILNGCTIVFLLSTGSIITPLLLGGPRSGMLATQIYQDVFQLFDFSKAGAMALILMALAGVLVLPLQLLERWVTRHMKQAEA